MRLAVIASASPPLSVEALHIAIEEAKRGSDVDVYSALCDALSQVAPQDPLATADKGWISQRSKNTRIETDRLEQELRGYKNNLIKESIRVREILKWVERSEGVII